MARWLISILLALAVSPVMALPSRYALLVGVSANIRPQYVLQGPANDVPAMERMLTSRYGFRADNIRRIEGERATRAGILAGWDWLISKAQPGDLVVFYYSGHGTLLVPPTAAGDNAASAKLQSALCPYDAIDEAGLIRDSEIGQRIDRLRTDQIVVMIDACHAGSASRIPWVHYRSLPPEAFGGKPLPPEPVLRQWNLTTFSGRSTTQAGAKQRERYLGACKDDQTAADDTFIRTRGDAPANPRMGAFTYYLLQEIAEDTTGRLTYAELARRVRSDLLRRYGCEQRREDGTRQPTQEPQVSGPNVDTTPFLSSSISTTGGNPTATASEVSEPLRVAILGTDTDSLNAAVNHLDFVRVVDRGEASEVTLESLRDEQVRPWRGGVPLPALPVKAVPDLLHRLHAALTLSRLNPRQSPFRVHLQADDSLGYREARIGEGLTLNIRPERDCFVTLVAVGADGTITGATNRKLKAGELMSLPVTAAGPAGMDSIKAFATPDKLDISLPASPESAGAHDTVSIVKRLAAALSRQKGAVWAADELLVRIRDNEE